MTNKQRKAKPTAKQGKEKDHPLELLFQLIVCLTAEGLMEWHFGSQMKHRQRFFFS